MTHSEKLIGVAKEVWDNMPFTNKKFNPESVNQCEKELRKLIDKKHLSWGWVDSVHKARESNQPIYIDLSDDWNWTFLTAKSGTRQQIIEFVGSIDMKKAKFVDAREAGDDNH